MNRLLVYVLLAFTPFAVIAQDSHRPITNDDVVSMTNAGLKQQTIILAIEQGPTNFDTSPQALVVLKKAGLSDAVLNAMLLAAKNKPNPPVTASPSSQSLAVNLASPDALQLLEKALCAVGTMDKLTSITATRQLMTTTQTHSGSISTYEVERVAVYPDRLYLEARSTTGLVNKVVLTPQTAYASNGQGGSDLPAATAEEQRTGMMFEIPSVAQHRSEFTFTLDGQETVGTDKCDKLRLKHNDGKEEVWSIDQAGRILRRVGGQSSRTFSVEYSDFQSADGLNIPFHRHATNVSGDITDTTIKVYQVNPPRYEMNAALFDPPTEQRSNLSDTSPAPSPSGGLTIKVLEEKSVPYVQKLGGGPSTSCNISGGSNTTMSASTYGNYTYGNASTTTNLHLNCNSYDTTVNWQHVLNVMLVEASDGNAYIIACDRAWRWSKCVPLRAGDVFNARQTSKGMAVQAMNAKGHESEPTYAVLQSKALH
jgi:hypothetical protein